MLVDELLRWKALTERGARVQRVLCASTSTKNPGYPVLMYVEPLVGPFTINTMPQETIAACGDHGHIDHDTIGQDLPEAKRGMGDLERLGISIHFVTTQLENEGIQKFIKAFDSILEQLAKERERVLASRKRPAPRRLGATPLGYRCAATRLLRNHSARSGEAARLVE